MKILKIIGIILLLLAVAYGFLIFIYNKPINVDKLERNQIPMYGAESKQDYLDTRDATIAEIDNRYVNELLDIYEQDVVEASKDPIWLAWGANSKGDYRTTIQRANQAWLIDDNNYHIYWLYGFWYGRYVDRDKENALKFMKIALDKYDSKYDFREADFAFLNCDIAEAYYELSKKKDGSEAQELLEKAKQYSRNGNKFAEDNLPDDLVVDVERSCNQ